ncbi:MAG: PepSY-associated TM helix domain-containing protein [Candidatus Sericytochromatia bacterium]
MHWRKANILIHRYLSYYFFGLTAIYSISGLAVNHIDEWNPSYINNKKSALISPLKNNDEISKIELEKILNQLDLRLSYKEDNIFYPSENSIEIIFSENQKLNIDTKKNIAQFDEITKRPILHSFNFLHLNEPKKFWTIYADIYAVSLLIIALTGMFMKKGKEGIIGKGGVIAILGMLIPIIFLFIYY